MTSTSAPSSQCVCPCVSHACFLRQYSRPHPSCACFRAAMLVNLLYWTTRTKLRESRWRQSKQGARRLMRPEEFRCVFLTLAAFVCSRRCCVVAMGDAIRNIGKVCDFPCRSREKCALLVSIYRCGPLWSPRA
jgi:hypothetical protein